MKIIIPGKPLPKKGVKRGKGKTKGGKTVVYNPSKDDMDAVKWQVKAQWKAPMIKKDVPVKVTTTYYMPIPKHGENKDKQEGDWHVTTPDKDNLNKFINDCMSGIVFFDDSQVCSGPSDKIYSDNPRTEIIVEGL